MTNVPSFAADYTIDSLSITQSLKSKFFGSPSRSGTTISGAAGPVAPVKNTELAEVMAVGGIYTIRHGGSTAGGVYSWTLLDATALFKKMFPDGAGDVGGANFKIGTYVDFSIILNNSSGAAKTVTLIASSSSITAYGGLSIRQFAGPTPTEKDSGSGRWRVVVTSTNPASYSYDLIRLSN